MSIAKKKIKLINMYQQSTDGQKNIINDHNKAKYVDYATLKNTQELIVQRLS